MRGDGLVAGERPPRDPPALGSGRAKRIYDKPATPYARLLASGALTEPKAEQLAAHHHDLNPAAITRKINTIQNRLLDSARDRTTARAQA